MDAETVELSQYLVNKLDTTPHQSRILVGIAGVPASGKSTLARLVVERVNSILSTRTENHDAALLLPLDGFHLTRVQLSAFPDPVLAHARRGAHWTFDAEEYIGLVRKLRAGTGSGFGSSSGEIVEAAHLFAPSFDHALKDPTYDAIRIGTHHRIILIEGLYTLLSITPWDDASKLLDERWWIEVDEDVAYKRLVKRHVETGVEADEEKARRRAGGSDAENGRFIKENMLDPTKIIYSRDIQVPTFAEL